MIQQRGEGFHRVVAERKLKVSNYLKKGYSAYPNPFARRSCW
jgi:hypothetical protein